MITNPLNTGEFNAIKCAVYVMRLKMDNAEHNAACLSHHTHTHTHTHTHSNTHFVSTQAIITLDVSRI